MSEVTFEGVGDEPTLPEADELHIGLFPRAIIELMPDSTCTDEDHIACMTYKGASWPEPMPGTDLAEEEPPWLEGGESD